MTKTRTMLMLAAIALIVTACSGDGAEETTTTAAAETTTSAATEEGPPMGPSSLSADAQTSDGSSIVVASVTLPAPGFIAVHGDGGGSPGPVIGHSDLLEAGESTDVTVNLDEPLAESSTLYPMVHIDVNGNGEYEFFPPDNTVDGPGVTDAGDVAVIPVEITVE